LIISIWVCKVFPMHFVFFFTVPVFIRRRLERTRVRRRRTRRQGIPLESRFTWKRPPCGSSEEKKVAIRISHAGDFGCIVRIGKQLSNSADKTKIIFLN